MTPDGPADDVDSDLDRLYDRLAATEELPVDRDAGWWLGEAQAVVEDIRTRGADPETVRRRLKTVTELLDEIDGTGHPKADEHVTAARELAHRLER